MTMCSQNTCDKVADFEWCLSVLIKLAYVSNVDISTETHDQLVDTVKRVRIASSEVAKQWTDDTGATVG
ncbi:hypothetical protein BDR03DRAFT_969130 [Suillus americanus]|nr:hypothetical protein BDR03DRAFT_969130 [Suillus americanus]